MIGIKRLFAASLISVSGLGATQVQAQATTSAGCAAVQAIGSQDGETLTFGPFSGFDEGFANQPSDGDTIRVSIGGRDIEATVEFVGRGGTTVQTVSQATNTFATIVVGPNPHGELAPLTINIRRTGGTSTRSRFTVLCTGTPNPGQPLGEGAEDEDTALRIEEEIRQEMQDFEYAESYGQFEDAAGSFPSIITTPEPTPVTRPSPQPTPQPTPVATDPGQALLDALAEFADDFIAGLGPDSGLSDQQLAELREAIISEGRDYATTAAVISRSNATNSNNPLESAAGGLFGIDASLEPKQRIAVAEGGLFLGLRNGVSGNVPIAVIEAAASGITASGAIESAAEGVVFEASRESLDEALDNDIDLNEGEAILFAGSGDGKFRFGLTPSQLAALADRNTLFFGTDGHGLLYSVWMRGQVSFYDGDIDGTAQDIQIGGVYRLGTSSEIGGFVGAFKSDLSSETADHETASTRYGLYYNHVLTSGVALGFAAVHEDGETDRDAGGVTGSYDFTETTWSASVSGSQEFNGWTLTPRVALAYADRQTDTYTLSDATVISESDQQTTSFTASLAGAKTWRSAQSGIEAVTLKWRAQGTFFDTEREADATRVTSSHDTLTLGGGADWTFDGGQTLSLDAGLSGLGDDTRTLSLSAVYAFSF